MFLRLFPRKKLGAAANQLCIRNAQGAVSLEALGIINPWCSDSYFKAQVLPLCPLCLSLRGVARTVLDSKSKVRRRRVHDCRRCKGCTFFLFLCELIVLKCAAMAPVILSYLQWFPLKRGLIQGNFLSTFRSVSPPSFSTIFELRVALQTNLSKYMRFQKCRNFGKMQSWGKTETRWSTGWLSLCAQTPHSFLPMDMEQHQGSSLWNFSQFLEAVVSSRLFYLPNCVWQK